MQKSGASKELNETADLLRQAFARAEAAELQVEEGKIAAVGAGVTPASQAGVASAALSQIDVSVEVGAIAGGISSVGGVGGSTSATSEQQQTSQQSDSAAEAATAAPEPLEVTVEEKVVQKSEMKKRLEAAGAVLTGKLTVSLMWDNKNDRELLYCSVSSSSSSSGLNLCCV